MCSVGILSGKNVYLEVDKAPASERTPGCAYFLPAVGIDSGAMAFGRRVQLVGLRTPGELIGLHLTD